MNTKNTAKRNPRNATSRVPETLTVPNAARLLDIHPGTLHLKIKTGVLTGIYQNGSGPGKRVKVYADEVRLFAAGKMSELATLVYDRKRGRGLSSG